ncbi:YggS family pyridoxal phosphate-dependent enzyme [Terriglobus sp.]|uniref:YggS family pyridoxal phosphate-dependent enzyme n=1 Tax=Terriglobus sp. TaxID=1889013 RepID=UPI003AFFBC5B
MSIAENLERVRREVDQACERAGRDPGSVRIMAVSKTHGPKLFAEAFRAGQRLFGESRVQEWEHKREQLHSLLGEDVGEIDMHLIGNLQNNKTSKAAWLYSAVDAVDTIKVAERLNAPCAQAGKVLPVLIEVKLSEEASKHGVDPYAVSGLVRRIHEELEGLEVRGLMTVPPYSDDAEEARPYFRHLCEIRDEAQQATGVALPELSMGMTHDFAVAIAEGSTCVRIGTAIFGLREYATTPQEEA